MTDRTFGSMQHSVMSMTNSRVWLLTVILVTVVVDTVGVPTGGRTHRRGAGGGVTSVQDQWISHMCRAQCEAYCRENSASSCGQYCQTNVTRSWIFTCHENDDQEIKDGIYEEKIEIFTRKSECPGTCSVLLPYQRSENKEGYVPPKPVPVLVRDLAKQSVTVSWTQPVTPYTVIYVLQESVESEENHYENWSSAHLVYGDHYERTDFQDACSRRKYRVAAVSRFGSFWFGDEVVTPDMVPTSPEDFAVSRAWHNAGTNEFHYILEWHNPTAWTLPNLKFSLDHQWICPGTLDPVEVMEQVPVLNNYGGTMEVRIPDYAVGCRLAYGVKAISRCRDDLYSNTTWIIIDLSCEAVREYYTGVYCTPPPSNPPGNPDIVDIRVVPGMGGPRCHVTWTPPEDLGSSGRVGFYQIFYGTFRNQLEGFPAPHNITVPPDTYQVDIPLPNGNPDERFGVMVMAGAPGKVIDQPLGIIYDVFPVSFPGEVLLDEGGMVVYQEADTHRVRVYWYPPARRRTSDVTRVAVQWGLVDKRQVDIDDDTGDVGSGGGDGGGGGGGGDGDAETAAGDGEKGPGYSMPGSDNVKLHVQNTTVVLREKNETYVIIGDLEPFEVYGVKLRVLSEGEADDISDQEWEDVPVHVFTVPPGAPDTEEPFTFMWTSGKPQTSAVSVNTTPFVTVAAVAVPLVVVVTVVLAVLLWWRWRKGQKLAHLIKMEGAEFRSYTYFMPVQGADVGGADSHVVADEWELPHSSLKVGPVLGSGAFGQVLLGRVSRAMLRHRGLPSHYSDPETCGKEGDDVDNLMAPVAIKMLKEGCDDAGKAEFLREIRLMKDLGHHSHVVSMLGCCTLREPYCLLVEHMTKGDLLSHLKDIRRRIAAAVEENGPYENQEVQFISPMDLLSFARQIALGMEFLSDKGYVHRDLAARNVLVGDRNEVKVGDFGLARYVYTDRVYVNRKGGKLPLKWMSVESIFDLTFSTASDVWSFGVVLFEIVTLGGTPYPTLAVRDLLTALKTGYRMERPDNCSDEMYRMMRACWRHSPNERPTFNTLRHWLEDMMADCSGVEYLDVNLNPNKDYYHCHSSDSELDSSDLDDSTVQGSDNVFREDDGSCGGSRNCASPDSGMSAGDSGEGSPNSSPQHTVVTSAGLNLGSGKLNALVTSSPSAKGKLSALAVTSSSSDKGKVNTLGTSSTSAAGKPHTFALTSSSSDEGKLHTLVASSAGDPVNLLDSPDVIVHRALSATDSCSTVTSVSSASSGTSRSKVIRPGNAELDKRGQNDEMTSVDDVDDKGNEADQEDDDDDDDVDDGDRDDIDDAKTDRDQQEDVDEEWGFSLSTSPMTVPDPMTCWDDVFEECEDRDLVPGTLLHRKPFPGLASRGQPFVRLVCHASACSSETAAGQISNTNRLTRWGSQGESVGTSSSSGESVMSAQHDDLSLRQFTLTSPHVHESVCRNTASQPTFRRFQVNPRSDPSSQRQQQKGQPDLVVSERPATSVLLHPGAGSARMAVFYTKNGTKDPGVATSVRSSCAARDVTSAV